MNFRPFQSTSLLLTELLSIQLVTFTGYKYCEYGYTRLYSHQISDIITIPRNRDANITVLGLRMRRVCHGLGTFVWQISSTAPTGTCEGWQ
jgi:hypothetical protein